MTAGLETNERLAGRRALALRHNPDGYVVNSRRIVALVAREHDITPGTLLAHRRDPEVQVARHAAVLALAVFTAASLVRIGQILNRDHSTVLWAERRAQEQLETDPSFAARFQRICALLLARAKRTPAEPAPLPAHIADVPTAAPAHRKRDPDAWDDEDVRSDHANATAAYGAAIVAHHGEDAQWR